MVVPAAIVDAAALVRFHTRHKLLLMAHSPSALTLLGRLVANAGGQPVALLAAGYLSAFMDVLEQPATRGGHVNALQHMVGYLRKAVTDDERRRVSEAIEDFAAARTPLATPLALIRQHATAHRIQYLLDQTYLDEARPVNLNRD